MAECSSCGRSLSSVANRKFECGEYYNVCYTCANVPVCIDHHYDRDVSKGDTPAQNDCAFCGYWLETTTYTFKCRQPTCDRRLCKWCAAEIVCPTHITSGVTKRDQKKGDDRGSTPVVQDHASSCLLL